MCLTSCNPFAVQGPEPAFININEATFIHDLDQGPRNHRIDYVEVFFENFSIGYYELPVELAVIPTLESSTITIFPAFQKNGQVTEITTYPLMTTYSLTQAFEVGEIYDITPEFDYLSTVVFDYVETFESGNSLNFDADEIDSTVTIRTNAEAANGTHSCLITTEENGEILTASNFLFTGLDNDGKDVYVEFNYKSTGSIVMGMQAEGNGLAFQIPFISLNAQSDWRKMYLDITPLIQSVPAEGYRLYFRSEGGTGDSAKKTYIDNAKILHQQ